MAGRLRRIGTADASGEYAISAAGLVPPLLIAAVEAGQNTNCRFNASLRARCMASVLTELHGGRNIANVTPITDRIVSDVAVSLKYIGPQQLVDVGRADQIRPEAVMLAKRTSMAGLATALADAGVQDVAHFDAVSTPMKADGSGEDAVLEVINHNRNYEVDCHDQSDPSD